MTKIQKYLLGSTVIAGAMAATYAAPAYAQDAEGANEEIIVTGSLISKNPNLELSSPVNTVDSVELGLRQTNLAEQFLRELPAAIPSIGSAVNNGNGGSSFVNLRGLGSTRNLVLLDGRRYVPADTTGRVDLNNIPLAVIERTDVLTGGATTTYGADAITGVVNFVTKRDFEGVEVTLSEQITEEGDGETMRADVTLGANFDDGRGNAVISLGYQNTDAVFQGDRDFSVFNVNSFTGVQGGSGNAVPANLFFPAAGPGAPGTTGPGGAGTTLVGQVDPDGNGFFPGFNGGAGPFNFNPFNIFQTPFERFNLFGQANYEINDQIEAYTQATFSKQSVETIIAPGGSFFNTYAINLNNPFVNAGVAQGLCDNLALSAAECTAAVNTPFGATLADGSANPDYREANGLIPRRSVEAGTRNSEFTTTQFNFVAGLRGDINDHLSYDISGTYGESERLQRQSGFARFQNLQNALIATDENTCAVSQTAGTIADPNCVPINLLGNLGSISEESIDYVFGLTQQVITNASIATVNATVSGDTGFGLSEFGAGLFSEAPIGFAVGAEYRDFGATRLSDEASQTPGAVVGGGGAAPDIDGSYDVFDVFAELNVPVFEDKGFAKSLTLDLGARLSDYSTAGSELTWKVGGAWDLAEGLGTTIRGNYQVSARAPNIGELFAPVTTGLSNLGVDPCEAQGPVGNADLAAVCIAQGANAGQIGSIPAPIAGQINVTGGGNPDLDTEDAETFTLGVKWEPEFAPNFSATIDYFDINVTGAVSSPTVGDIITGCFNSITAASAASAACSPNLIERSPATGGLSGAPNELRGLILQASNLGTIETDGVDLSLRYQKELNSDLFLNTSFDGTWVNKNTFQSQPGAIIRDCVGFFSVNCGSPQSEFSFSQRTSFNYKDDYTLSLRWRYLSGLEQEPLDALAPADGGSGPAFVGNTVLFGDVDFTRIPDEHYFDLTFQWDVTDWALLTLTATNLLNNQPAIVGSNIGTTAFNSGNIYPSSYDPLGRRYGASVRFKF